MYVGLSEFFCSKRGRFEYDTEPNRWTLSKNELVLHNVLDSGVGRLESGFDIDIEVQKQVLPPIQSLISKKEQIAVLEASLPEHTLHKLSLGEFLSPVKSANGVKKKDISPMSNTIYLMYSHIPS